MCAVSIVCCGECRQAGRSARRYTRLSDRSAGLFTRSQGTMLGGVPVPVTSVYIGYLCLLFCCVLCVRFM